MNSTGPGTSGVSDSSGIPDLDRRLAETASEALRDRGRIVVDGTAYKVVIPNGARPGDPVYLQGPDRSALAVRIHATAQDATPEELEL